MVLFSQLQAPSEFLQDLQEAQPSQRDRAMLVSLNISLVTQGH